ncbi:secretogranin-2a [Latimeria chalumnae]|uniref:Secretogranin II n=1 Tax=Latimeria chalumnae TaxID=7897 RepID=H2ZVJ3_LATCH|nr:PREDICTED: secretogranin-2 [Latimeria chalumnae]|eukprot:XP_006012292.1 PREDICTED: secretogranin-2 [Latimeria chalumnae]
MAFAMFCSLGAVITILLNTCCVDAASLRDYKFAEKEPGYSYQNFNRLPSADMMKALEYIENLRQKGNNEEPLLDYDDFDRSRSFQGSPSLENQGQSPVAGVSKDPLTENESQWLRFIIKNLKQLEKESKITSKGNKVYGLGNYPVRLNQDYDMYDWPERRVREFRKSTSNYQDDESRDNPYKRTNEIVEEQYTPQSLATLESVFKELGKLTTPSQKLEEQKILKDNEDEVYRGNNIAYEDVVGGEDWNPVEEKVESQQSEEEEIRNSEEEIDTDEDQIRDEAKRLEQPNLKQGATPRKSVDDQVSDEVSKFMNYYKNLMSRIESSRPRTGPTEQKRTTKSSDNEIDPQAIYQLIEISRNLQIPPEDLIDMLEAEDDKTQDKVLESEDKLPIPNDLDEISDPNLDRMDFLKDTIGSKAGYIKRPTFDVPEDLAEDLTTEDILNVLGMDKASKQNPMHFLKQLNRANGSSRLSSVNGRPRGYPLSRAAWGTNSLEKRFDYDKRDYGDDDLANYLTKVLAKYPELLKTNEVKRVQTPTADEDQQDGDNHQRAVKEYIDQMEPQTSDHLSLPNKRLLAVREKKDTPNRQNLEENMLIKMLDYINQENSEKDGREYYTRSALEDNM